MSQYARNARNLRNAIRRENDLKDVTELLTRKGYEVHPPREIHGLRFLVKSPDRKYLECQFKRRAFVQWETLGNDELYMIFPGKDEAGSREWYLVPHDKLFEILKASHGHAPKWNNPKLGEIWHCPVSNHLAEILEEYAI